MPVIQCPIEGCNYATTDVEASIAVALLTIHNNVHVVSNNVAKQRPPKLERPMIAKESSEEVWNTFKTRWMMFKRGTHLSDEDTVQQLFQCCEEELGDAILKSHAAAVSGTEEQLLTAIKQLAVIPVAISVRRSELLSIRQDHGENARSFVARLKGKAATCTYSMVCPKDGCDQLIDFTDVIVKDVLVAGLCDEEIRKEVLGWSELDHKTVNETISFIEAKEMARDALLPQMSTAAMSAYRKGRSNAGTQKEKVSCNNCRQEINKYYWSRHQKQWIECVLCIKCHRKSKASKDKSRPVPKNAADETSALLVGTLSSKQSMSSDIGSVRARTQSYGNGHVLDHYIFDSADGWKQSESMVHPTLRLHITVQKEDYDQIQRVCPNVKPSCVTVVTDTGAQSCLWSLSEFYKCGFKKSDLIPVKRVILAANREEIKIKGAILVRLSGEEQAWACLYCPHNGLC